MLTILNAFHAMVNRTPLTFKDHKGNTHSGIINGVMAEDGSGKCWLIKVSKASLGTVDVFVRIS